MTTGEEENVFVKDSMLHLQPTLQDQERIDTNNIINLLKDKSCTSKLFENCVTSTNTTNGTIVNPVKSARLSTRLGPRVKFGRIEVEAKLPSGDWLWPAIWMLPTKNKYGEWPLSGEIDIAESRGNNHTYENGGNNIVTSALHWGPNPALDAWWRNTAKRKALHTTYANGFHTFGVEWSENYIFTYVDTRLLQVMYTRFERPFFKIGKFPLTDMNGTRIVDPWSFTGRASTPFDEDFYLILNVAVGGTNGWFEDGVANKPWVDGSPTARKDFWNARDQWYPSWEGNSQMVIKRVTMWQQQGYNGC